MQPSSLKTTLLYLLGSCALSLQAQSPLPVLNIDWNKPIRTSQSTPTLQVVTNPMLNPGAPIHDGSFAALKALGADYVRFVPWLPYPKIAVVELQPPTPQSTSWDFTYADPVTKDFLAATENHSTIMNFSTIPAWMFKTEKPVTYPEDPNQVFWNYTQGTELRDATCRELGSYFARLVSWYTNGGFTDENGSRHESGYHYKFPFWEVLNEVDSEHTMTPEDYTKRYDAIVEAIHQVSPNTKFMGLALAFPSNNPKQFEYFLDPKNHKPGIPLDFISFHFYATPALDEGPDSWQHTFLNQANGFLAVTRYIMAIRDRLSPNTKIDTDELGVILPTDGVEIAALKPMPDHIPHIYWNAAASLFAYLFIEETKLGIDVIGESQLVGYPSQFPSVSMINYNTGQPNARYWVLKLLKDNFHAGDQLMPLAPTPHNSLPAELAIQAFLTPEGKKVLLVNQSNSEKTIQLPDDFASWTTATIDESTGDNQPRNSQIVADRHLTLSPFAVTVLREK